MGMRVFELLLASANPNKVLEIEQILAEALPQIMLCSLLEKGIQEKAPEHGSTFLEIAREKALFYSRLTPLYTLAEDSGLEVAALGNRPGIHSARYAGEGASDEERIAKLLTEMRNINERRARFVAAFCLALNGKLVQQFQGEAQGEILERPRGKNGFGYDPVFYYLPLRKTFAEMAPEQKNRVSHRAQALSQVKKFLSFYPI